MSVGGKFIFDFQKLVETFTKICPDFTEEPSYAKATVSRRFAEQIIFEYSKQLKEAKARKNNRTWRFLLDDQSVRHSLIISMYTKNTKQPQQPVLVDGCLELTFKEASLLAVAKYCQIVPHLVEREEIVLTPLAGAAFAKDDMPKLAAALEEPLSQLLMAVISSCQTDGYHLEHSRCYIAVAALTRTVADLKLRATLVKDCIKMYQLHGKDFDIVKFEICSKFLKSPTIVRASNNVEIDKLVSEIMAFNMTDDSSESCNKRQKPKPMRCAALFTGPIKNNDN
ncbi:uncharacterized protein LOC116805120 isoform X2 [Drosophila grimshawi]|nr:uncharacterized protein LOC116805120 isoform X2 [Drosophila grimshawi]XP_032591319.1 uncharacterized protein LOC116805120 isoform X2 [Drosophila grimshawi]